MRFLLAKLIAVKSKISRKNKKYLRKIAGNELASMAGNNLPHPGLWQVIWGSRKPLNQSRRIIQNKV